MKKKLFALVASLLGGASLDAQSWPGYPAAAPGGGLPPHHGPAVLRRSGLEPYPDQGGIPAKAQPAMVKPASHSTTGTGGFLPPPGELTDPAKGPPGLPPGLGQPAAPLPSSGEVLGPGKLTPILPGGEDKGAPFVPPAPKGLDGPPKEVPFTPPLPAPVETLPKALPPGPKVDVLPPSGVADSGIAAESPSLMLTSCAMPAPGEPVMMQLVDHHPLSRGTLWYFSADYVRFWTKDQAEVPALALPGAGPQLNLRADPDNDERSGARIHLGRWVSSKVALEGDYFFLGDRSPTSRLATRNLPLVQLPFFSGIEEISRTIIYHSRMLSPELNVRYKTIERDCFRLDMLLGARYLEVDEDITIQQAQRFSRNPVVLSDALVLTTDRFGIDNRFLGGQIGAEVEYVKNWFFLQTFAKVAIGSNRQRLTITGDTQVIAPPQPLGNLNLPNNGLFAGPTNIGVYSRDRFAFLPELGIHAGVRLHECVRFGVGYNFLFLSEAARPADQIDRTAGNNLPLGFLGPAFPASTPALIFNSSNIWAQGLSIRLELRY